MKIINAFLVFCILVSVSYAASSAQEVVKGSGVKGGMVAYLGDDPEFLTGLKLETGYLVHGVMSAGVEKAQKTVIGKGLAGKVTVSKFNGKSLPFTDDFVNLLVVNDKSLIDAKEITRVLAPRGVAMIGGKKLRKPVPSNIDDWTHQLHGPDNNAVAHDSKVAPPYHTQWEGGLRWDRSHDFTASFSVLISSEGKLFSIQDEGDVKSIIMPSKWFLVARDAFNGIVLWKRSIPRWAPHLKGFRAGPQDLPRRVVAVDGKVYVTLGYGQPIEVLKADTGKTMITLEGTKGAHEILVTDDTVFTHIIREDEKYFRAEEEKVRGSIIAKAVDKNEKGSRKPGAARKAKQEELPPPSTAVMALDRKTGEVLWEKVGEETQNIHFNTLTAGDEYLFFQNGGTINCLNGRSGKVLWTAERPSIESRYPSTSPTVVYYKGVLLSADRGPEIKKKEKGKGDKTLPTTPGVLYAYSAKSGKKLWTCPTAETFNSPFEVFVMDGLVWTGGYHFNQEHGMTKGRDPKTGKVVIERSPDTELYTPVGHASCYRSKATDKYLIQGRAGIDFVDVKANKAYTHHFVRGTCQFGVLPCNGYIYSTPHACNCYAKAKLSGMVAMAGKRYALQDTPANVLEKGPAFAKASVDAKAMPDKPLGKPALSDWPTYRGDSQRRSSTKASVPGKINKAWELSLKGRLTQPVAVGKLVYVANRDTHTVHAIDTTSGKEKWSYVAGGEIDSPPTIDSGLALFGSADGWVYCLDAVTGELAWRFLAAPNNQRITSYGQLKSIWPVPGSVVVVNGKAYFAAGRSSYMDGGVYLYKLDVKTGKRLAVKRIYDRNPETDLEFDTGGERHIKGALNDVLSSDGKSVFMRHRRFDLDLKEQEQNVSHIFSAIGFLDDSWWPRSVWTIGTIYYSGYSGWSETGNKTVAGQILSFDDKNVYGFGHKIHKTGVYYGMGRDLAQYRLFGAPVSMIEVGVANNASKSKKKSKGEEAIEYDWSERINIIVRAMVLAGDKLIVAGSPDVIADEPIEKNNYNAVSILDKMQTKHEFFSGDRNGLLSIISPVDGKVLSQLEIQSPPVWNGMIAAHGKIFITDNKGRVVCFK